MIQTPSDCLIRLLLLVFVAVPAFGAPDEIQVEVSQTVSASISATDSPQTIAQKMAKIDKKLENNTGESPKGLWAKKIDVAKKKYNFVHRLRVGRREMNASDGQVQSIPAIAVIFNGTAAMIGIHALESLAIGPAMIWASGTEVLPASIAAGLKLWGWALMNPFPTGLFFIDAFTESFCWITFIVVQTDAFHKGVYWVEYSLIKISGKIAQSVGLDRVWHAIMEKQSGRDRLQEALARGGKQTLIFRAEDLSYPITDKQGRLIATLKLGLTEKEDVKLTEFELHAEAATPEGRATLSRELKVFGKDIRDAVLHSNRLVEGEHGVRVESEIPKWKVEGTSVLLPSHWICKRVAGAAATQTGG